MYPIGRSTNNCFLNDGTFLSYKKAGITHIEISEGAKEAFDLIDFDTVKLLADRHNIKLWSVHLPFLPFEEIDISCTDDAKRQSAVDYYVGIIKKTAKIGIEKAVIHPSGEPIAEDDREKRLEAAKKGLCALSKEAEKLGVTICVEDLPRTCLGRDSDDILELLNAHPSLRVCFDTNHLLKQDNVDFIHKVGDKIVTLHVSDYDFINERHWICGEGLVDWNGLYNALKDIGYDGVWMYEAGSGITETAFGKRSRVLTSEDYVNIAKEIFSGKKPTVI